jgi:NADPH:quinone reductase-like Zn-dependent oxidoreductase
MHLDAPTPDRPTMKALVVEQFGEPPVVRELARPQPGPGEVLVRVRASGVNPLDVKIATGGAAHAQVSTPAILGLDVAGVVAEVGPGVTDLAPGDEVFGIAGGVGPVPGSLAEYVVTGLVARAPRGLDLRRAAALPLATITAWEALVDRAGVGPGDRVLVQGGAGGVGQLAVQIALARGAQVSATATGAGMDVVRGYGAVPIDYRRTPVEEYAEKAFDIVVDTVGGPVLDASFAAVRRGGHVVSILGWGTHSLAPLSFRSATYSGVFTLLPLLTGQGGDAHVAILRAAADLVEQGVLRPRLDPRSWSGFDSVPAAYAAVGAGTTTGKVVIDVGE